MTGMLASVSNLEEALLVADSGADIIDLKQPAQGALGALTFQDVRSIVTSVAGKKPVSATIGDLPMQPELVFQAVQRMAETGVDYVKIGFFPEGDWRATLQMLMPLAREHALIAVLFADANPDLTILSALQQSGFRGVMLDTMHKRGDGLLQVMAYSLLADFVKTGRSLRLLTGLAGSLRIEDIPALLALQADYLGFRGALCANHERIAKIEATRLQAVRQAVICG